MATRRDGLRIKPRFWLLLLTAACMFTSIAMVREGAALDAQYAEIAQLEQQKLELRQQNDELKRASEFSTTDAFIERQARALGIIKPGEVRYVVHAEDADYAQGGN